MTRQDYVEHVGTHRAERDAFFRESPDSPVPPGERARFGGLDYYPIDPRWRIVARFEPHVSERRIELDATGGDLYPYRDVGTFTFDTPAGGPVTLHAFRPVGEDWDDLFVPFRDGTSGKETYGAGRYLEPEPENGAGGLWALDFNLCYSPFCAFSDAYSCTLPPRENWLQVPVRAGERTLPH